MSVHVERQVDRNGGPAGEGLDGRPQPAPRQDRRVDSPGQLLEVGVQAGQPVNHLVQLRVQPVVLDGHRRLDRPQFEPERHDALLRPVVQIPLEPSSGLIRRGDDADPRRGELGAGLGVENRGGHQIGEIHHARLGFGGHRLLLCRADDQGAPGSAVDGDGSADTRDQAASMQSPRRRPGRVAVVVHPGRGAGTEHVRRHAVAGQREMFTDNEFAVGVGVARGDHDAFVTRFVAHQGDVFHPESAGQLGDRHRIDVGRIGPPGHQRGHPAQRRLLLGKRAHRDVAVLELASGLLAGALQGGVDLLAVAGSGEKRLQRRHHSANPLRRRGGQPRRHLQAAHRHLGIMQRDRLVVGVGGHRIDGEGGVRKFQDVGHSATRGVQRGGESRRPAT